MEEKESQARALLDKTNRQFNECNALYHAAAQRCGLSDAAFWTLYALVTSCEPLTRTHCGGLGHPQADAELRRGGHGQKRACWRFAGKRSPQRKES